KITYFFRPEGISHIEDPNACILIGCEDKLRTLEGARAILVQVVRAKVPTLRAVIFLCWSGEGDNRDRIGWLTNVHNPGILDLVRTIICNAFIGNDDQITIR